MQSTMPNPRARLIGALYLLNIVTGLYPMFSAGTPLAAYNFPVSVFATACYVAVTVLLFLLLKPVNFWLSLIAMLFSMAGSAVGFASLFGVRLTSLHFLVFFGFYCVLLGALIFRSTYLPRLIGVLLVIAGAGWLAFFWPSFAKGLVPYIYLPGLVGEGALTLWLLIMGVDTAKWRAMTSR